MMAIDAIRAPLPHQVAGAEWLASRKRALLAWEAGAAKTRTTLMAAEKIGLPVTVVCPPVAKEVWRAEVEKWGIQIPDLAVHSYEYIRRYGIATPRHPILVLDEGHYLKNVGAGRSEAIYGKSCSGIGGFADGALAVWVLSGTLLPNHLGELYPHLRALLPHTIPNRLGKPMSYAEFEARYLVTRPPYKPGWAPRVVGHRNESELRARLRHYVDRKTKEQVIADLPPMRIETHPVPLEPGAWQQGDDYEKVVRAARQAEDADSTEPLASITSQVSRLRKLLSIAKVKATTAMVKDFFEDGGKKLIVWAYHRETIEQLRIALKKFNPVTVVGGMTSTAMKKSEETFQTDPACGLFLGQIVAGGTAITLTAASDEIFVELDWIPSNNAQAAARAHRMGTRRGVLCRVLYFPGTVDEIVTRVLTRKTRQIRTFWNED